MKLNFQNFERQSFASALDELQKQPNVTVAQVMKLADQFGVDLCQLLEESLAEDAQQDVTTP